ncbi:Alpha/Beta hydrolase protein [Plectosphaerella cucumerina]|uniref:Alpha/Beta hydrolase protein n=1 Tax=Plectosphaerella cucumerina TaxID=40658 RepID=A0A8K0X3D0_9PEZI|nr:Alpha/Beta hydrolase protein [Plectosphaerella cucumerina]
MTANSSELVLPRPGSLSDSSQAPIPGPTESVFTATFGALLPPAKYLTTTTGKAAYYEILPSAGADGLCGPDRVLFIHGVQTPALGMLPLARALQESFPQSHLALVDLWGHGLSDTPVLPHEPSLFFALIDALLDHLGWPTVHLVGFSFGGATTVGYVASRPSRVKSFTLVAPAGLIPSGQFSAEQKAHLQGGGDEVAARKWVLQVLEGGELVVPSDWKERVQKGEVVAEAVREWQMREHPGHTASVVAVFRDGGVMDNDAQFVKAAASGIPSLAVLGEKDDLCTKEQLEKLGFSDVVVVPDAGHGVVRERVPEVAAPIRAFWSKLSE